MTGPNESNSDSEMSRFAGVVTHNKIDSLSFAVPGVLGHLPLCLLVSCVSPLSLSIKVKRIILKE